MQGVAKLSISMGCSDRLPVTKAPEPECGLGNRRLFNGHGLRIMVCWWKKRDA